MKNAYLVLAIAGAIGPYVFFAQHFEVAGFGLGAFAAGLFATPAAAGFTLDLLISSAVFWMVIFEARRRDRMRSPSPWPFVLLNVLIGLSCALPAYLYMRAKADEAPSVAQPST